MTPGAHPTPGGGSSPWAESEEGGNSEWTATSTEATATVTVTKTATATASAVTLDLLSTVTELLNELTGLL
jgi:hypothetical protein